MKLWVRPPTIGATCLPLDVEPSDTIDDVKAFIGLSEEHFLSCVHLDAQDDALRPYWPTALVAP